MLLIDPYNEYNLPNDVVKFASNRGIAIGTQTSKALEGVGLPQDAPPLRTLDRWNIVTHQYRQEIAAETNFLANLFKGTGKKIKAGVTQEAKQYRIEKTGNNREVEVGVAVRLAVAASNFNLDIELSVPNLAAASQLQMADTRIGIYVMGFGGPIGDIMPAPSELNVEKFNGYMEAFAAIQRRVFDIQNAHFLSPTVLGYADDQAPNPKTENSTGKGA